MVAVSGVGGRIKRAVAAGALGQAINMAGRLALVPMFLSVWGVELYGEWLMVSSLMAMLAMSDFGGGVYFVNRLTELRQLGANDKFMSMLSTSLAMFVLLPLAILFLFAGAVVTLPLSDWMGLVIVSETTLLSVLALLGIQICIALPQGLLLGVYRALGAQATSIMLGNGLLLGQLFLIVVVLVYGGGLVAMAASQVLPVTLLVVWIIYDLRTNRLKQPLFKSTLVSLSILREGFSPSMHFFAIRLAQAMVIQGSVLIVGRMLGSAEVALFATLRMLINLLKQILGLVSHAAWPEITKLATVGDKERLQLLHILIFRASLFASVLYILIMEVVGEQLFQLWVGDRLTFDPAVMRAFGWYVVITIAWTLSANLLMATNCHEKLAKWQLVAGGAGLGLCAVGASFYGLTGAVVGLMLGEGLVMWVVVTHEVNDTPWGISAKCQNVELAFILPFVTVALWPALGMIVIGVLGWRALSSIKRIKRISV